MENDRLKDLLQEKLADYEALVDNRDWEIISKRLQQRKKRKAAMIWFTAGGAVAAAVLLFLVLRTPVDQPGEHFSTAIAAQETPAREESSARQLGTAINTKSSKKIVINEEAIRPALAVMGEHPERVITTKHETHNIVAAAKEKTEVEEITAIAEEAKNVQAETIERKTALETTTTNIEPEIREEDKFDLFKPLPDEEISTKKKHTPKWALAFAAGQSSSAPSNEKENFMPVAKYDGLMNGSDENILYTASLASLAPAKTNDHVPLSFGLSFRYYFAPQWALESGLVYTYLATDYEYVDHSGIERRLHYLGIPLNIVWQFVGGKWISCYVSGGGMAEKGLRANYIPNGTSNEEARHESISGLQWSLSAQIGVSYNMTKRLSLYFEPGIRYFIDNDRQPETIRTENPLNFSLTLGLRTNF